MTRRALFCVVLSLMAIVSASATPAQAATVFVDFDSLSGMTNSPGAPVPVGRRLSNQLQPTTGATFSSVAGYVAVVEQIPGITQTAPNAIGGVKADDTLSYAQPIDIVFSDPNNAAIPAMTSFVEIRGDMFPSSTATATMDAFDLSNNLIGSVTVADTIAGLTLSLSLPHIHRIRITQDSPYGSFDGSISFDNLQFETLAVPEPSTEFLAALGTLAIAGVSVRRSWRPRARHNP